MKKVSLVLVAGILVFVGIITGIIITASIYHKSHVVLDGPSMEPTIHNGQNLTIKKYGSTSDIKRGDIVEYQSTNQLVTKHSKSGKLIHRIIALPGERITINNGAVLVFNAHNPNGFNPDSYLASGVTTQGTVDTTLAQDTYFVMGDNRPNALDSRSTGPVSFGNIIGKVTY
jgi:signal peptidase I